MHTAGSVYDEVIEFHQSQPPAHQATGRIILREHPLEGVMIRTDHELGALKVCSQLKDSPNNSITLPLSRRIVTLLLGECFGVASHRSPFRRFVRILLLKEDDTDCVRARIAVDHVRSSRNRKSQNWGRREDFFKFLKCFLLFFCWYYLFLPVDSTILLQHVRQRPGDVREAFHELPVNVSGT